MRNHLGRTDRAGEIDDKTTNTTRSIDSNEIQQLIYRDAIVSRGVACDYDDLRTNWGLLHVSGLVRENLKEEAKTYGTVEQKILVDKLLRNLLLEMAWQKTRDKVKKNDWWGGVLMVGETRVEKGS